MRRWAGVPRIDAAMQARLSIIAAEGARHGMRREVFAKLGDSLTESGSFLQDVGHGWFDLGAYEWLGDTIAMYRRVPVDADGNDSFAHASQAAAGGWSTADALEGPSPNAVERELDTLRPALAFVLFGTNDIDRGPPAQFRDGLDHIVAACLSRGVIPVLSTVPDRLDGGGPASRVPAMNDVVQALARTRGLPVIDLNAALAPLPRHGIETDGIHLSAWQRDGDYRTANFTDESLRDGYNVRNLITLQTLDALRRIVFGRETPDA